MESKAICLILLWLYVYLCWYMCILFPVNLKSTSSKSHTHTHSTVDFLFWLSLETWWNILIFITERQRVFFMNRLNWPTTACHLQPTQLATADCPYHKLSKWTGSSRSTTSVNSEPYQRKPAESKQPGSQATCIHTAGTPSLSAPSEEIAGREREVSKQTRGGWSTDGKKTVYLSFCDLIKLSNSSESHHFQPESVEMLKWKLFYIRTFAADKGHSSF